MYKVLLVDDEGIVIDSLKFIIEKNFGEQCTIQSAKTGRSAVEVAEQYRPDIIFMDIQMPGLNGIEAMTEIKERNGNAVFIVLSAYDKFNYAKQAIDLGVLEYLMKPVNSNKIVEVLKKAMLVIEQDRLKRSRDLQIREKLKTVVPMLENGFIYALLFQEAGLSELTNYRHLLEIDEEYGMVMVLEYGDDNKAGLLTNPVGAGVRIHQCYEQLSETVKDFMRMVVGPPMGNRIVFFVPHVIAEMEYGERIQLIENMRVLIRKISRQFQMSFKLGIGSVQLFQNIHISYREAMEALRNVKGKVIHIEDLPMGCHYEPNYPIELEEVLFEAVKKGNISSARRYAEQFYEWMFQASAQNEASIRLKSLEFVLFAEYWAYLAGGSYQFTGRNHYLKETLEFNVEGELRNWFVEKIFLAARNISLKQEKQASSVVCKARDYINHNFAKDLTLEEVSKEINISPYYFSKLFKEETGENFIEYVTSVRIEHAKELLKNSEYSIKEVCIYSGYSDPNYFSRIFKKYAGLPPSEYREGEY